MLSGTPIFQGIRDLRGELNFLRLEPFAAALDDGFFEFAIEKPWEAKEPQAVATLQILCLVALRRSKNMTVVATGAGLLDLKPLTVEFIPVPQTDSERAIYCWMEYIVASELELTKNNHTQKGGVVAPRAAQGEAKSRTFLLRLLRELCITPVLINGGLGAAPQLHLVNKLMINHNRREMEARVRLNPDDDEDSDEKEDDHASAGRKRLMSGPVMSCDDALRFLSQHEEQARTGGDDMVTEFAVGGGRGATNRDRAVGNAVDRLKEVQDIVAKAETALIAAKTKRAKNRWHRALEQVSTGEYSDGRTHKFSGLWKWRRLILGIMQDKKRTCTQPVAQLLSRGWRPRSSFMPDLFEKRHGFLWCHPHSVVLSNIPPEVTQNELVIAMKTAALRVPLEEIEKEKCNARLSKLNKSKHTGRDHLKKIKEEEEQLERINEQIEQLKEYDDQVIAPTVVKIREQKHINGFWKSFVLYNNREDLSLAMSAFGRSSGVPILSLKPVPHIQQCTDVIKERVAQAAAEFRVHPSEASKNRLDQARKELACVSSGLRCVSSAHKDASVVRNEETGTDQAMVIASKPTGIIRPLTPRNASALISRVIAAVEGATAEIYRHEAIISKGKKDAKKFQRALTTPVSSKTAETSAYGVLMALHDGDVESTLCPICLGHLGEDDNEETIASSQGGRKRKQRQVGITMVSCGRKWKYMDLCCRTGNK
jgi:hypothetical protein